MCAQPLPRATIAHANTHTKRARTHARTRTGTKDAHASGVCGNDQARDVVPEHAVSLTLNDATAIAQRAITVAGRGKCWSRALCAPGNVELTICTRRGRKDASVAACRPRPSEHRNLERRQVHAGFRCVQTRGCLGLASLVGVDENSPVSPRVQFGPSRCALRQNPRAKSANGRSYGNSRRCCPDVRRYCFRSCALLMQRMRCDLFWVTVL